MTIEKNKQVVISMLAAISRCDVSAAVGFLANNATWKIVGNPEQFALAGNYNKAQITELFTNFLGSFEVFSFNVESAIAEDNKVAVKAVSQGQGKNGKLYNNQYLMMYELKDGKVVNAYEFFDQLHVLEFIK